MTGNVMEKGGGVAVLDPPNITMVGMRATLGNVGSRCERVTS